MFSISSPKVRGGGGGGGEGGETHSRPTYFVCIQLTWSASCVEFRALMIGGEHAKKREGKVAE